jgi:hypothetical protein
MPIIITAHMTNTNANSIALQGATGPSERSQYDERGDYDRSIAPQHGLECRIGHVGSAHDAALAEH